MKSVMSCIVACVTSVVCAHSQMEELAVSACLVRMIMSSPEWEDNLSLDADSNESDLPFQCYEDLFAVAFPTNCIGSTWTPQDRKTAFENFIGAIPVLSTNGLYRGIATHGGIALSYCREHGVSNVLSSAETIVTTKHSVAQSAALLVIKEFASPSSQFNDYAMSIFTNSELTVTSTRSWFMGIYAEVLKNHRHESDPESFTNGVLNLYRAVAGGTDGAIALDKLLLETYPDYQLSLSRLSVAQGALSGRFESGLWSIPAVERYFVPVTNLLLNASQPLSEVEALHGVEGFVSCSPNVRRSKVEAAAGSMRD